MQKIFLGIPVLENFKVDTVDCLLSLFQFYYKNPHFLLSWAMIKGSRQVHFARNGLAKTAMDQEFDYIAFIDADMTFPPDLLHRLFFASKDITGVLYKGRLKPHPYNVFYWDKDKTRVEQVSDNWKIPNSELIEVDGVGTGAILIKRKVFETIGTPYFFYGENRSEDIMFCEKARRAGFKIYVNTKVQIGHIGDEVYI